MARHEFGVMPQAPAAGQRFEQYEPGKYRCIPVEDDEIERLLPETLGLPMYWHTVDRPGRGLCYAGITDTAGDAAGAAGSGDPAGRHGGAGGPAAAGRAGKQVGDPLWDIGR